MNPKLPELEHLLESPACGERLAALREIRYLTDRGELPGPPHTHYVNNHIHTIYSFSPYSPAMALYLSWKNGLKTAGIMDHDSLAGAEEFLAAGEILGMPVTVGLECRIHMAGPLSGRRLNNPDQKSVAYVAIHGIPHQHIQTVQAFFAPLRGRRNQRNRLMCEKLSETLAPFDLDIDFQSDVLPLSQFRNGGTVTERHILFALTQKLIQKYPSPDDLISFLKNKLRVGLSKPAEARLRAGGENPYLYPYDLLGVLKSGLLESFYVDADRECMDAAAFIALTERINAYSAYAYLGDVQMDVTGDKKAQAFEDSYLDLLFSELSSLRFRAVTYMPTRNTPKQLQRVMDLCRRYDMFQISGEDINSPRQSFICRALDEPGYRHLIDATYMLIEREQQLTRRPRLLDRTERSSGSSLTELRKIESEKNLSAVLLSKAENRDKLSRDVERHAACLMADAEARGILQADTVIILHASDDSCEGWAKAAAMQGRRIRLILPAGFSAGTKEQIQKFGAEVYIADSSDNQDLEEYAKQIAENTANAISVSALYADDAEAAYDQGIGTELWNESGGDADLLIGSTADSRMLRSAARYLKKKNPRLQVISVSAENADELKRQRKDLKPFEERETSEIDKTVCVSADEACAAQHMLMRCEGIQTGSLSGAVLHAAVQWAQKPEYRGKTILMLLPDTRI